MPANEDKCYKEKATDFPISTRFSSGGTVTIDTVIKTEIIRLAKREARKLTSPLREELKRLKKRDAERRNHIVTLEKLIHKYQAREHLTETASKVVTSGAKGRLSPRLIRSLRKKLGLSQNAFAGLLDVSMVTIGNWEKGKNVPKAEMKAKMLSFRGMKRREVKLLVADLVQAPERAPKKKARKKAGKAKPVGHRRKAKARGKR